MGLLAFLLRLDVGERSARHEALEQSPLHFLPAPILVLLAFLCLLLAACVAGLTLGLMSLDAMQLDILTQSSNLRVAAAARAIKPVRAQGNLLLVTLLFANTVATELLPLVLEALVPGGFFSLIVSVISIMLFGEIIPQAVCSRHALEVGAYMIHFVKVLRWILYPITYPIAFCLDFVLGEELCTIYDRHGLKALVDHHASESILTADETTILKSTLEFSQKKVMDILTPAEHVFKLSIDATLNRETLLDILRRGHSRVPLYDGSPSNIVCLLLVKQLLLVDPAENIPIRALISKKRVISKIRVARTIECSARTPIADLLNEFQLGRSHMAMVYDDVSKPHEERMFLGLVSIEDIIEEILDEEINDETDQFVDNISRTLVNRRHYSPGKRIGTIGTATARAVSIPGCSSTIINKEIDVQALRAPLGEAESGQKIRPDWKKPKPKNIEGPSEGQRETGDEDVEDPTLDSDVAPAAVRQDSSKDMLHSDIRYSSLPGQSSLSFFGEEDGILPEDEYKARRGAETGNSAMNAVIETLNDQSPLLRTSMSSPAGSNTVLNMDVLSIAARARRIDRKDGGSTVTVRPLPENATGDRESELPRRKSKHNAAMAAVQSKLVPPPNRPVPSQYGAISSSSSLPAPDTQLDLHETDDEP